MPLSPVEDILRTRLTTLGVEEHRLTLEGSQIEQRNQEWVIYDVGGSRTQRGKYAPFHLRFSIPTTIDYLAAWVPYFDDGECAAPAEPNKRFLSDLSK